MEKNSTGALINIGQDDCKVKIDAVSTLKIISLDMIKQISPITCSIKLLAYTEWLDC